MSSTPQLLKDTYIYTSRKYQSAHHIAESRNDRIEHAEMYGFNHIREEDLKLTKLEDVRKEVETLRENAACLLLEVEESKRLFWSVTQNDFQSYREYLIFSLGNEDRADSQIREIIETDPIRAKELGLIPDPVEVNDGIVNLAEKE